MSDTTTMPRRLVRFSLALAALLLALPVVVSFAAPKSRRQAYLTISDNTGSVNEVVDTIFDAQNDADVLFVGTSPTMCAVNPYVMSDALSRKLKRTVRVRSLAFAWGGYDLEYCMLRDYLARHRAKAILLEAPHTNTLRTGIHPQMHQWLRCGDFEDVFSELPLKERAQVYGEEVLGAPRQLLNLLRPNRIADEEEGGARYDSSFRARLYETSDGSPFRRIDVNPSANLDVHAFTAGSSRVRTAGTQVANYAGFFLARIAALARRDHLPLILIHYPFQDEYGDRYIPEEVDLATLFGRDCPMVGPATGDVFAGLDRETFDHLFWDSSHLNRNGQVAYTPVLTRLVASLLNSSEVAKAVD